MTGYGSIFSTECIEYDVSSLPNLNLNPMNGDDDEARTNVTYRKQILYHTSLSNLASSVINYIVILSIRSILGYLNTIG